MDYPKVLADHQSSLSLPVLVSFYLKENQLIRLVKSVIPLYFKVESEIRERISSGEIVGKDGSLPSEEKLCELFGVSRITVRKALSELVLDSVIYRKSGKGTFIQQRTKETRSFHLVGDLEELVTQGGETKMKILNQKLIHPPKNVQEKLDLQDDQKVFYYNGFRSIGEDTIYFFEAYVLSSVGKFFDPANLSGKRTIFGMLERDLGIRITEAEQVITAAAVDKRISNHFGMTIGKPILLVQRILFVEERKPVELTIGYYDPAKYQYQVRLVRGLSSTIRRWSES